MQDLPNGGGRRSKHWPPGIGDPRDATGTIVGSTVGANQSPGIKCHG